MFPRKAYPSENMLNSRGRISRHIIRRRSAVRGIIEPCALPCRELCYLRRL